MRVRRGDDGVSGRRQAGAHHAHALAQANVRTASSTRSLPHRRDVTYPKGQRTPRCSTASTPGHRSTLGCTSDADEGATGPPLFTGATRLVRNQVEANAIRPRVGSSRARTERVRECDLITCCVASPPRCRAIGIGSRASRETARLATVGDEKGEGTPDRGSSVAFTRCEVNRSRPTRYLAASASERCA